MPSWKIDEIPQKYLIQTSDPTIIIPTAKTEIYSEVRKPRLVDKAIIYSELEMASQDFTGLFMSRDSLIKAIGFRVLRKQLANNVKQLIPNPIILFIFRLATLQKEKLHEICPNALLSDDDEQLLSTTAIKNDNSILKLYAIISEGLDLRKLSYEEKGKICREFMRLSSKKVK